jgi:D-alanyl-D-alanine carboxypeptidase (penicillin-binding protein 5/6)
VPIKDGVKKQIATATASDFAIVLQKSKFDKIAREVTVSRNLKAPIKKGEVVGEVVYKLDDEEIGRVDIVADEDMGRVGWFKRLIRKILAWLGLD